MNNSTSTSNCNNYHRNVHRHYLMIPSRACWVTLTRTDVQIHTDVSQGRRAQMELQKHVCQHIRILRSEIGAYCWFDNNATLKSNYLSSPTFWPKKSLVTHSTTDEEETLQDIYPYYVLRTRNKDSSIQLRRTDFLIIANECCKALAMTNYTRLKTSEISYMQHNHKENE